MTITDDGSFADPLAQASQCYDGTIPDELRRIFPHGSYQAYYTAFLITAERNFTRRLQDILISLRAWRLCPHYPAAIRDQMLDRLSAALNQARSSVMESRRWSQPRSSASAVMALPISTI